MGIEQGEEMFEVRWLILVDPGMANERPKRSIYWVLGINLCREKKKLNSAMSSLR